MNPARAIICTGTTHAETSKTWPSPAKAVALIMPALTTVTAIIITTTATTTTATTTTAILITIIITAAAALITPISFARETAFIGTIHATINKIYFLVAPSDKLASTDNAPHTSSQLQFSLTIIM